MTAAQPLAEAPSFREQVAAEVRAHLARRKMSGRALALLLQEQPTWVSRRLNGVIPMDTDDMERIAAALGLSPIQLITGAIPSQRPGMIPQAATGASISRSSHASRRVPRRLSLVPPLTGDYQPVAGNYPSNHTDVGTSTGGRVARSAEGVNHAYAS